jgi:phospholipase C
LITQCIENPSPSWNESHVDWNLNNYYSPTATLDGFVWTNAHDARNNVPPYYDTDGIRSMGYYDDTSLNYYYYMATQFSTSDRWFSPVMSRTSPNREYMIAPPRRRRLSDRHRQRRPVAAHHHHNFLELTERWNQLKTVNPDNTSCATDPAAMPLT